MRSRELRHRIKLQLDVLREEITANAQGGHFAAGLSGEGYAGGFRDALSDVLLLMSDVEPNNSRFRYWPKTGGER